MKKSSIPATVTAFLFTLLLLSISIFSTKSAAVNYEWGTQFVKVKKSIPSQDKFEQFSPKEKPGYKNKIMSYITAIDNNLIEKILILRVNSNPKTDYLFVNNKLYTIMENYGNINTVKEKEIQAALTSKFGQPQVQQDKNFYIYSYNSDKTKVLFYLLKSPGGKSKCKVYYYAKKLFRMLITE